MTLEAYDFGVVRRLLEEHAAIVLSDDQRYLVESRLAPLARAHGYDGVSALVTRLSHETSLQQRVIEALTTHETSFFRDRHPFEALRSTVLPALLLQRASERRLSIWSAGTATGQEAYSLAILLLEAFPLIKTWKVRIVGTDISSAVLKRAKEGHYSQLEVNRGLPTRLLVKYFEQTPNGWRIKPEVRDMMEWRSLNLAHIDHSFFGFDLIFLRNVLIYFSDETRRHVLHEVSKRLRPGGSLFLGSTESALCASDTLESVVTQRTTYYTKR